ncbi:uncharacterized protein [Dermacentor albipictus]|uniref:uncharacterized protein isoform X4 n=1 Tax=Dermacentor albipictus TaxID=60249 RepID=UPI0031FC786E
MYGGPILTRKRRCCMCNKVMSQVQMARAAAVAVASCPDARDCPMCDYVATARSSLIIHMRKHTGERPYRCHLCPAAFAKSSDRSRHFRTHQLHKPFNCGSCGKSFAQRRRDLQSWTCRHASTPRLAPDTSASCVTLPRRSLTTYVLTCTHITLGRPASMPSLDNIGSAWSAATSRSTRPAVPYSLLLVYCKAIGAHLCLTCVLAEAAGRDGALEHYAKEDWCQGHITVHHPGKDALVQAVQICYDQLPQHGVAPAESRKQETIPVSPLSTSL